MTEEEHHAWHKADPEHLVSVGHTRIVERVTDGKKRTVQEREVKEIPYQEWEGRCRECFP
jgi:hypothetical protein